MGLGYTKATGSAVLCGQPLSLSMCGAQDTPVLVAETSESRRNAAMPITYTNAKGKTYYLHQGTTKTGKPKYYFSMEREGQLAEAIPEGFEIYENPNAQVFLRRIPPKLITDEECQVVADGMRKYAEVQDYKIDVKGNAIVIYTADQDIDALADLFNDMYP